MANINSETVRKSPMDFVYIFVTKDYLTRIAQVFSPSHATNIESKYKNAMRAVSAWGKENSLSYEKAKAEVKKLIIDQYGITPGEVLVKMANGEMIAGKDFKNGVYGVGDTPQLTFSQNPSAVVDPTSGKISFGDNSPEALWQTINQQGKTVEMNYTFMGNTYTSRYDPRSGQFIANTYGDKNGMQFANGTTYTPSKASSVWENLNTALPIIKDCLTWAAQFVPDVLGKFIPITTANTVPQQSDYYVESGSPKTATFGVIGALLIGGLLLSGGIKPKKKG